MVCRAFSRVKAVRGRLGSEGSVLAVTPTLSLSASMADVAGASPAQARVELLKKSEAQNMEIQLKGIKLPVKAIIAVRPPAYSPPAFGQLPSWSLEYAHTELMYTGRVAPASRAPRPASPSSRVLFSYHQSTRSHRPANGSSVASRSCRR